MALHNYFARCRYCRQWLMWCDEDLTVYCGCEGLQAPSKEQMMSQAAQKQGIDPNQFATLHDATRRYRLNDPTMTNPQLATRLGLNHDVGDFRGSPNCCFFSDGYLVAIRTKQDEVSIFHLFQRFQHEMENYGERIQ